MEERTTDLVWDCECGGIGSTGKLVVHFHRMNEETCSRCGSLRDESPQAIRTEVIFAAEHPHRYETALPFDAALVERVRGGE